MYRYSPQNLGEIFVIVIMTPLLFQPRLRAIIVIIRPCVVWNNILTQNAIRLGDLRFLVYDTKSLTDLEVWIPVKYTRKQIQNCCQQQLLYNGQHCLSQLNISVLHKDAFGYYQFTNIQQNIRKHFLFNSRKFRITLVAICTTKPEFY